MAAREWVETASSWRKIRIFTLALKWRGVTAVLLSFSVVQLDFVDFTSIMITFREVRDLLAVACFEDIMDEDEFVLLWDFNTSKNLDFPYEDYARFDLQFHRGFVIQTILDGIPYFSSLYSPCFEDTSFWSSALFCYDQIVSLSFPWSS